MAGAEVTNALAKIVDDEQKVRDAEVDIKSKEGSADRNIWPTRPMMSDYCGLKENDDIYFINEVKNKFNEVTNSQQCTDFKAGPESRRACVDCSHRVTPESKLHDQKLEETYNRLVTAAIAMQGSPQSPQSLLQSHRAGVAARRALEIGNAYAARGRMPAKPAYLDYCSRFSTEDDYVLCVFQNPHHTCSEWASINDSKKTSGGSA